MVEHNVLLSSELIAIDTIAPFIVSMGTKASTPGNILNIHLYNFLKTFEWGIHVLNVDNEVSMYDVVCIETPDHAYAIGKNLCDIITQAMETNFIAYTGYFNMSELADDIYHSYGDLIKFVNKGQLDVNVSKNTYFDLSTGVATSLDKINLESMVAAPCLDSIVLAFINEHIANGYIDDLPYEYREYVYGMINNNKYILDSLLYTLGLYLFDITRNGAGASNYACIQLLDVYKRYVALGRYDHL